MDLNAALNPVRTEASARKQTSEDAVLQARWGGLSCAGAARLREEPGAACLGRECRAGCGGLGAEGGEALDGEDLLVEDLAELAGGLMGDGFEVG